MATDRTALVLASTHLVVGFVDDSPSFGRVYRRGDTMYITCGHRPHEGRNAAVVRPFHPSQESAYRELFNVVMTDLPIDPIDR